MNPNNRGSRINFLFISLGFNWMPHHGHGKKKQRNFRRAEENILAQSQFGWMENLVCCRSSDSVLSFIPVTCQRLRTRWLTDWLTSLQWLCYSKGLLADFSTHTSDSPRSTCLLSHFTQCHANYQPYAMLVQMMITMANHNHNHCEVFKCICFLSLSLFWGEEE